MANSCAWRWKPPAHRTSTSVFDRLESSLTSPTTNADGGHWLQPVMHRGTIGLSGVLVLLVGVAEAAWLLQGSGLTLLIRFVQRVFGLH